MNDEVTLPDDDIWPQFEYPEIKPYAWKIKGVPRPVPVYDQKTIDRMRGRDIFVALTETWAEQLQEGPSRND